MTRRPWTPDRPSAGGGTTITVKRCCNGCGEQVGDVSNADLAAAISGAQLPDVRDECPRCTREVSGFGHLIKIGVPAAQVAAMELNALGYELEATEPAAVTWSELPTKPWPPEIEPTGEQLADWLASLTRRQLSWVLDQQGGSWKQQSHCFHENHPSFIEILRGRVRQLQGRLFAVLAIDPEDHATKSRDYGRGFAEAIRLVREAAEHDG